MPRAYVLSAESLSAFCRDCVQAWLARGDADLPLAVLEVHFALGYVRGTGMLGEDLREWIAHAQPLLTTSAASSHLEPRLVANMLQGALSAREDPQGAIALLTAASDGAKDAEYVACTDRWVGPFAQLELANLHIESTRHLDAAAAALYAATRLSQRYYSFHSWHQSAVRAARVRLNAARAAQAEGGKAAAALDDDEDDDEENDDIARMRAHIENEEAAAAASTRSAAPIS